MYMTHKEKLRGDYRNFSLGEAKDRVTWSAATLQTGGAHEERPEGAPVPTRWALLKYYWALTFTTIILSA